MIITLLGWIIAISGCVFFTFIFVAFFYYAIVAPILFIISLFNKKVKNPYKEDPFNGSSGMPREITRIMGPF